MCSQRTVSFAAPHLSDMSKKKNTNLLGISLIVYGVLSFFLGYPVYAYTVNAFGGEWCNLVEQMALYIGIPSLLFCLIGSFLLLKKWWITILLTIPIGFIGFAWFVFTTIIIGVFITGKGW